MPKIEVDENELLEARALKGVIAKITADPKRALELERLHKEADPDVRTPRADMLKPAVEAVTVVSEEVKALKKQLDDERTEREKERTTASLTSKYDSVIAAARKDGYTDKGIEELKKIMEEKSLMDFEAADAIFQRRNPAPPPSMPGVTGSWNFMDGAQADTGDAFTTKLLDAKSDERASMMAADQVIHDTLASIRSGR
jgi:hypothetical protein